MEDVSARSGELCSQCGTPLEPAESTPIDDAGGSEILLRCANGHEMRVTRHQQQDERATVEP